MQGAGVKLLMAVNIKIICDFTKRLVSASALDITLIFDIGNANCCLANKSSAGRRQIWLMALIQGIICNLAPQLVMQQLATITALIGVR